MMNLAEYIKLLRDVVVFSILSACVMGSIGNAGAEPEEPVKAKFCMGNKFPCSEQAIKSVLEQSHVERGNRKFCEQLMQDEWEYVPLNISIYVLKEDAARSKKRDLHKRICHKS